MPLQGRLVYLNELYNGGLQDAWSKIYSYYGLVDTSWVRLMTERIYNDPELTYYVASEYGVTFKVTEDDSFVSKAEYDFQLNFVIVYIGSKALWSLLKKQNRTLLIMEIEKAVSAYNERLLRVESFKGTLNEKDFLKLLTDKESVFLRQIAMYLSDHTVSMIEDRLIRDYEQIDLEFLTKAKEIACKT
jgi:hypothetical protein